LSHPGVPAGVVRSQHYVWMKDPEYAAAFAEAKEEACDALESEARRRALAPRRRALSALAIFRSIEIRLYWLQHGIEAGSYRQVDW
jgi:hypothetical protein